jgi:alpha-L-fucosidase 2
MPSRRSLFSRLPRPLLAVLAGAALSARVPAAPEADPSLQVRFSAPAGSWAREALPVGNGRIGAMVFGHPTEERIQFNDISLWSGGANESGGYEVGEFGTFQSFGDLLIGSPAAATAPGAISGYERTLDLGTGVQRTTWTQEGVRHTREVFASRPHEVIVVRWTADRPAAINARLRLGDPRAGGKGAVHPDGVALPESALPNGLRYAAHAVVRSDGGKSAAEADAFVVRGADALTILLAAATDYALDPGRGFRSGTSPDDTVRRQAEAAARDAPAALRAAHIAAHAALMDRVSLRLGETPPEILPLDTPARIRRHAEHGDDPALEALLFQYGRYLLASSSRPGGLPANLQGLWADSLKPSWFADYHTNINIQMNYWLAEPANLAECHEALLGWVLACIPESRRATQKAFGEATPGWTMRTSVNAFGGNGWKWNLPASAWLAQHFWEHYAFGRDAAFLRDQAWPVFRDVSAFWLHHLKEDADGRLVAPDGWSPEHGPREDGVAHDQQIVWDLFTNTLAAAEALGLDDAFTRRVAEARARLRGPQVGSWGQLMEWTTERPELERSQHRHTSHLFAVHPGSQITVARTPELAKAAAVSLEARGTSGDSRRSWTWPWRGALWARLGEPEKAHAMVLGLFRHNLLPNLWATHPPFQMDGNFGITAGIAEMLLQSHAGEIAVLPALPAAWSHGSFRGLRARGGFTLAADWRDGKPTRVELVSHAGEPAVLRVPRGWRCGSSFRPEVVATDDGQELLRFATRRGERVELEW